jgi:hypothetical protein
MGLAIKRDSFSAQEHREFSRRIRASLKVLDEMINSPDFGYGQGSFGAELEVYLVDKQGQAAWVAEQILASNKDSRLTHELNQYNLEYNLSPVAASGEPFTAMANEMSGAIVQLANTTDKYEVQPVAIGILPTLSPGDIDSSAITDRPRYRALSRGLSDLRGGPFNIHIDGQEPLAFSCDDVSVEGANTSLQVHWRVNPDEFVSVFNAVQLVSPLVLSLASNSPFLLGHVLWEETRVAVFKQSIDHRHDDEKWRIPTRVPFGFGWLRHSPIELFKQSVALYPPLLPVLGEEDSEAVWRGGGIPRLDELRMHQGTIWPWNRAIYDSADGGHLRIEMRSLPAGPTVPDMVANAALTIGLAYGLRNNIEEMLPALPFQYAEQNFYRTARLGIDATVLWPRGNYGGPEEKAVLDIVCELLPIAELGLQELGVASEEARRYLNVIKQRIEARQTGASWQRNMLSSYEKSGLSRPEALSAVLLAYQREFSRGVPVSEWAEKI